MSMRPILLAFAVVLPGATAWAQSPCGAPPLRDTKPLQAAIGSDEAVFAAFDQAALACQTPGPNEACDQARLRCSDALAQNLKRVIDFDEGAWVRDMLLPYLGQKYQASVVLPTVITPVTDVSCSADHLSLQAASQRRKGQADRRRLVLTEYGKYQAWAQAVQKACQDRVATEQAQAASQRAEAEKLAAAAAAAKLAEETRQAALKAAEEKRQAELKAAEEKRQAELKAAEQRRQEELKAQQRAQEEAARRQEAQVAEERKRQEAIAAEAARKQAEAEAQARAREEQRKVEEREGKVKAAEQKARELAEKEEARQAEARASLEERRRQAEAEHQKKVEELKRAVELSQAQKDQLVAEEERKYREAEERRQAVAQKEIAAAADIDRSHERQKGKVSLHAMGGVTSASDAGASLVAALLGGNLSAHFGLWGVAPSDGMASGAEFRLFATVLHTVGPPADLLFFLEGGAEFRGWYRRVGFGLSGSYQRLVAALSGATYAMEGVALGPSVSVAIVDTPYARFIASARWLPFVIPNFDVKRAALELEIGFEWFSITLQAGTSSLRFASDPASGSTLGFYAALGLGGRLRW